MQIRHDSFQNKWNEITKIITVENCKLRFQNRSDDASTIEHSLDSV